MVIPEAQRHSARKTHKARGGSIVIKGKGAIKNQSESNKTKSYKVHVMVKVTSLGVHCLIKLPCLVRLFFSTSSKHFFFCSVRVSERFERERERGAETLEINYGMTACVFLCRRMDVYIDQW